ncbi:hypothetical protein PAHAL_6G080200 [Panicum hallii]|uniref:Uncharacterized protein n=1 Tax=Panicum hallii TaxID=206008 RepID=A0A2T8IFM9_9POAL|nr:hypothetical protein PAHAL_6G080200 [Panicum hallii]
MLASSEPQQSCCQNFVDHQLFFFCYVELQQLRHRHFIEPQTLLLIKNQSMSARKGI